MPKHTSILDIQRTVAKQLVRHVVVPHKGNDYRPHLIRGHGIAIVVLMIGVFQLSYNFVQTGSVLGQKTEIDSQQLLDETNKQRNKNDEQNLQLNATLTKAAELKANDMFTEQYWSHTSPSGTTPWQWFEKAGYQYTEAGENLAKGFHSSSGVVEAWMNSPEHKQNLLDINYKDVGFAIKTGKLQGKTTTLVVALYGTPSNADVQITNQRQAVLAATDTTLSPIARVGIGLQSMTPALLGSLLLIAIVTIVALMAHLYRNKLPYTLRKTWQKHHGLYKALGMACFAVVLVALYGGGQI